MPSGAQIKAGLTVATKLLSVAGDVLGIGGFFGLDQALGLKGSDADVQSSLNAINQKLAELEAISNKILSEVEKNGINDIAGHLAGYKSQLTKSLDNMYSYQNTLMTSGEVDSKKFDAALTDSGNALTGIIDYIGSITGISAIMLAPNLISAITIREEIIWELGYGSFANPTDFKPELQRAINALQDLRPGMVKCYYDSVEITVKEKIPDFVFYNYTILISSENDPNHSFEIKLHYIIEDDFDLHMNDFNNNHDNTTLLKWFKDVENGIKGNSGVYIAADAALTHFTLDANNLTNWPEYDSAYSKLTKLISGDYKAGDSGGGTVNDHLSLHDANHEYNTLDGLRGDDTLDGSDFVDLLRGGEGNDFLDGNGGDDILLGGDGNDTLLGRDGKDRLDGGAGIDTASYQDSAVAVIVSLDILGPQDTKQGTDILLNIENLVGSPSDDVLTGSNGANVLDGGGAEDDLYGRAGDDVYKVNQGGIRIFELANEGTDTVIATYSYALAANVENLILTGTDNLNGNGNELDNTITGNAGNNTLSGGAGVNTLVGGLGNDTYMLTAYSPNDKIIENADGGTDTVKTLVDYTLASNLENLTLFDTEGLGVRRGTGNELANVIIGNTSSNELSGMAGNDTLSGGDGNDTLDGGDGNDTMTGGAGNDTYKVDAVGDVAVEDFAGGTDTVVATIAYTLAFNLENLTLTGTGNLNGTGNTLGNTITGNAGNNLLSGMAGNDTLYGGDGNDTLDGGQDINTLDGGAGDDIYLILPQNANDTIIEGANGGTDTVKAQLDFTLGSNLENLTLLSTNNSTGKGNELANVITGNTGNDLLSGLAGNDTLSGGNGNDTLNGGEGADKLFGGAGNDTYYVDSSGDRVYETATASGTTDLGGKDTVVSSSKFTLGKFVENLTLTGKANLAGTGNDLANTILGNGGANTLDGLAGNDTLKGNGGNDTLKGGAGNDKLYGGDGKDTLTGGGGKDTFIFNTAPTSRDTITDFGHSEGDKIQLSKAVFKGFAYTGALHADDFYAAAGATTAHDATDRLIYNTTTGILYYDADGKGGAAAVELALLGASTHSTLVYGDFLIIA